MKGPEAKPSARASQAAAELHRESDLHFLVRKFRIKKIQHLPRIQTNPPQDNILLHVCSDRQSRKDCHKNPQEEMLATREMALKCWIAPQDVAAQADLAGRGDVFKQVKNQEL